MHLMSARLMSDGLAVDPVENSEFRTSGQVENRKKKKIEGKRLSDQKST
jgi:hypothetical protein